MPHFPFLHSTFPDMTLTSQKLATSNLGPIETVKILAVISFVLELEFFATKQAQQ